MQLLYPASPMNPLQVDEAFAEEYDAVTQAGLRVSLFDVDSLAFGLFSPQPPLQADAPLLYRGWMLTVDQYRGLIMRCSGMGAAPLVSAEQYAETHELPNWYPQLSAHTAESHWCEADEHLNASLEALYKTLGWSQCFVKDFVKSNSTGRGSVAKSVPDMLATVDEIRHYRNMVEGGVVLRAVQSFVPESERRLFVVRGEAFAMDGVDIPSFMADVTKCINSPFYSVDIVQTLDEQWQVVELGDGQVSDLKEWSLISFLNVLKKRLSVIVEVD